VGNHSWNGYRTAEEQELNGQRLDATGGGDVVTMHSERAESSNQTTNSRPWGSRERNASMREDRCGLLDME